MNKILKKQVSTKTATIVFGVLIIACLFAFYVGAQDWTEPVFAPPEGNVPAPINTGDEAQEKTGTLTVPIIIDGDNTSYWVNPSGTTIFAGPVGVGPTATPFHQLEVAGVVKFGPTSEPTEYIANGLMYYDSSLNKFRCYQNGWIDCIGGGDGGITCDDCNAQFVNVTGDTMTGRLFIQMPSGTDPSWSTEDGLVIQDGSYSHGYLLKILNPGGSPWLVVDENGKVGIWKDNPNYNLDVSGDANATRLCIAGDCRDKWLNSEENLELIRGKVKVDKNGIILSGSGFSVSHDSTGNYTITFGTILNPKFSGLPTVIAIIDNPGATGHNLYVNVTANNTAEIHTRWRFRCKLDDANHKCSPNTEDTGHLSYETHDLGFSFIAVGPRY